MPELICHPHSPSRVARALAAEVTRTPEGKLSLHYALHGDVARMNLPPPAPPRIGWKLWRRTCCEVFVRAGGEGYHEFNFSPSAEWAAYAHNDWLETRITFGWAGFAPILAMLLIVFLRWFGPGGIPTHWLFVSMIWLALAGCLLHARFDFPFQICSILALFLLLCAALFCLSKRT